MPEYWKKEYGNAVKKIKIEDAVGTILAHDLTEVRPGEFKGVAFNAGHRVSKDDLFRLRRLGKRHLFVLNLSYDQIHENDAAIDLATALLGPGVIFDSLPLEGKIELKALHSGLFKINSEALFKLNMIPEIMCVSIHNNTVVARGSVLAAVRIMPLLIDSTLMNKAINLISAHEGVMQVKPFQPLKARLIVTGNEIYEGLIEDGFEMMVKTKLDNYGATLVETVILPDNVEKISDMARFFLGMSTDLLITTGGMSVDPDDLTCHAIRLLGPDRVHYGAAVTPGAMFQIAYFKDVPVIGIPACALYHKITIFDLILPRLVAGEKPDDEDLARLAHGGMCMNCEACTYPCCPFGKN